MTVEATRVVTDRRTLARVAIGGSWPGLSFERLRPVPRQACRRPRGLCQTAASL